MSNPFSNLPQCETCGRRCKADGSECKWCASKEERAIIKKKVKFQLKEEKKHRANASEKKPSKLLNIHSDEDEGTEVEVPVKRSKPKAPTPQKKKISKAKLQALLEKLEGMELESDDE